MRNEEQRREERFEKPSYKNHETGNSRQLLKSAFESLANLVDSEEPLKDGAKMLGSFFDGTYRGGSA